MYGYTRWHWKAQDYSSCIGLYPLQVGCHIMSRTKQQWDTVVNSWQNKSRYKCGSCSTCQESTNRCQTTQFKVACDMIWYDMTNFISSREKLHCSAQELHTIHKIASNYNKQQHNERHAILLLHQPCRPLDNMYYDHEVEFRSLIEYGMNDFCVRGLTFRHR